MSTKKKIWLLVCVGLLAIALFNRKEPTPSASVQTPPQEPTDPAYNAALLAVYAVKKSQRNPDSFVLEEAYVMQKAICLTWRGQNGFGGMNRGQSVVARDLKYALNDHEDGFTRAWNRDCANKSGRDLTSEMQGQLRYNPAMSR